MLVLVMSGMLIPFAVLHYLDYVSLTWRVSELLRDPEGNCLQASE